MIGLLAGWQAGPIVFIPLVYIRGSNGPVAMRCFAKKKTPAASRGLVFQAADSTGEGG